MDDNRAHHIRRPLARDTSPRSPSGEVSWIWWSSRRRRVAPRARACRGTALRSSPPAATTLQLPSRGRPALPLLRRAMSTPGLTAPADIIALPTTPIEAAKRLAARTAVDEYVRTGMAIGVGSGSTIVYGIQRLAERVHGAERLAVRCVPTSFQSRQVRPLRRAPCSDYPPFHSLFACRPAAPNPLALALHNPSPPPPPYLPPPPAAGRGGHSRVRPVPRLPRAGRDH